MAWTVERLHEACHTCDVCASQAIADSMVMGSTGGTREIQYRDSVTGEIVTDHSATVRKVEA